MNKDDHSKDDVEVKETTLEFVQLQEGKMVLRGTQNPNEVFLVIEFSETVREVLGVDAEYVGHHMIQAAIHAFMQKQANRYHAFVYDKRGGLVN